MNPRYPLVAERAAQRCEYCHAPESVFNFAFQVEHIHPRAQGGSDTPDNLALACSSCNVFKSDATTGWDGTGACDAQLFNPRSDAWNDHFVVDRQTAEIIGLSSVGRATLAQLQMNRPRQVAARKRWMQIGIFP